MVHHGELKEEKSEKKNDRWRCDKILGGQVFEYLKSLGNRLSPPCSVTD